MNNATPLRTQSNLRGILLMTAGFASFSIADTLAKLLTSEYHAVQIVFTRQLGLMSVVAVMLLIQGPRIFKSTAPFLQFLRGCVAATSAVCFVLALTFVPLADAVAVSFVAPFLVTVLGALILGEAVGIRRWSAVAMGFIGALVIIRPGFGVFHPAIFFVLIAALAFALRQIISRYMGNRDQTNTTVAYTAVVSAAILFVPAWFYWQSPKSGSDVAMMIGLAALAGLGEYLFIRALEVAHAVVLAPVHYSLIIFGTFWGFTVFGHLPDFWTWVGAAIIVLSGLYMIYREVQVKHQVLAKD